MFAGT